MTPQKKDVSLPRYPPLYPSTNSCRRDYGDTAAFSGIYTATDRVFEKF